MPSQNRGFAKLTRVRLGDLHSPADQHSLLRLLELYAERLPGRMRPLPAAVIANLIPRLQTQPGCRLFLAETSGCATGMAICFDGFSTFEARPLLNIHDLTVDPAFQRQGIGARLLVEVIQFAREAGYCAVTLEVAADNPARQLYARHGFQPLTGQCDRHLTLFGKLELC